MAGRIAALEELADDVRNGVLEADRCGEAIAAEIASHIVFPVEPVELLELMHW